MNRDCKQTRVMSTREWTAIHGPHGHPAIRPAEHQPPAGTYRINLLVCPCGAKLVVTAAANSVKDSEGEGVEDDGPTSR